MGLRLWRRIKIAPGVTVNVSKRGLSTSFGPRGAKVTLGHGRVRKTVGLPGTGLFYTSTSKSVPRSAPSPVAGAGPVAAGNGGHRLRNAAIVGALVVGAIAAMSGNGGGPVQPSVTPGQPTAAPPLGLIGGGGSVSPSAEPRSTAAPVATAQVVTTPQPTKAPRPTPKPTPKPVLALSASVTSPVNAGAQAKVTAKTHAGARCSIEVDYKSGSSSASGLNDKKASSTGSVSWTWTVGSSTTSGTWDIYVSCSWSGLDKTKHLTFRVR
jgi:hypothetical protein